MTLSTNGTVPADTLKETMLTVQTQRATQRDRIEQRDEDDPAEFMVRSTDDYELIDDDLFDVFVRFRPEPLRVGFLEGSRLR